MATLLNLNLRIGNTPASMRTFPTVLTSKTPYLTWTLPPGVVQRRYNLRFVSREASGSLYIHGEQVSSATTFQWPYALPMADTWLGLIHVEVVISSDPNAGAAFEYTTGTDNNYFVCDSIAENLYNPTAALLRWRKSVELDFGQALSYHVKVSPEPNFTSADTIMDELLNDSGETFTSKLATIDINKTYFWKVRAYDGLDYSDWTVVHGFKTSEVALPEVDITDVHVLGNATGDVVIDFTTNDVDSDYINVLFSYTGGNAGLTQTPCSLINSANMIPNGAHSVIWRSGNNEQLVSASDYMIYAQGHDGVDFGNEDRWGPITMDNSTIGLDPGGFGAVEIEFPMQGYFFRNVVTDIPDEPLPVLGNIGPQKLTLTEVTPIHCSTTGHCMYMWLRNPEEDYEGYWTPGTSEAMNGSYTHPGGTFTVSGGGLTQTEDGGSAPMYTLDPNDYGEDGYPKELDHRRWPYYGGRVGYIKMYRPDWAYSAQDPVYGWRGWKVVDDGGTYVRVNAPGRLRGKPTSTVGLPGHEHEELNSLVQIGVPYYIPITDILQPFDANSYTWFGLNGNIFRGKYQYILGQHIKTTNDIWSTAEGEVIGRVIDLRNPYVSGWFAKKQYTTFDPDRSYVLMGSILMRMAAVPERVPIIGYIRDGPSDYFSGVDPTSNPGMSTRPEPPYPGDSGFILTGTTLDKNNLEALQIIYLQPSWDAYNTVHWMSTMGATTNIHLQYTQYTNETDHGPWLDATSRLTTYNAEFGINLVSPLLWHTYIDTINATLFESGSNYRFRVRMFDMVSKTFSEFVYSGKFEISHNTINPVNVLSTRYDPWKRHVQVTFRIDDTDGDTYRIVGMQYSPDGRTFTDIPMREITGETHYLQANVRGDQVDETDIITHNLYWDTRSYTLQASDKYRIRIFATLNELTDDVTVPVFKWWMYNNPRITSAESEIAKLLGKTQTWLWNEETGAWEEQETAVGVPGVIAMNEKRLADLWEGRPTDPDEYTAWLNQSIGGATRIELIQQYEEQNRWYYNVRLPQLYAQRDTGEILVRRNLIQQGYYCNGYEGGLSSGNLFRFRVESKPYDDTSAETVTYNARYEVYFHLQIDFHDTFDSQSGQRPLRDIFFHDDGTRIQAGPSRGETNPGPDNTWEENPTTTTAAQAQADPNAEGKPWSGQDSAGTINTDQLGQTSSGNDASYSAPESQFDTRGFGTYCLPQTDLPGERSDYYLDASYPAVDDELPSGHTVYNGDYPWRIAAYNIITGSRQEIARPLITSVTVQPSENRCKVVYQAAGDESLSAFKIEQLYFSTAESAVAWEGTSTVTFPTDRPVTGGVVVQDDRFITTWIPQGKNRSRPWAMVTDTHQYYLWYTKPDIYSENIIMHAMGKGPGVFGEYGQCFPFLPTDRVSSMSAFSHFYGPCVVQSDTKFQMWCTATEGAVNKIVFSESLSSFDGDSWSSPVVCEGLTGCYYPSVLLVDGLYHMWCGKLDGGVSKVFYFTSNNGVDWTVKNGGNAVYALSDHVNSPCVVVSNGVYVMYFTEYTGSSTKISSALSEDGLVWTDYQVEVASTTAMHPCVCQDRYMGNLTWRMYFNDVVSGSTVIRTAVMGNRSWLLASGIYGDVEDVVPTVQGAVKTVYFPLAANGLSALTEDSVVGVRFYCLLDGVLSRNYYVHSEWSMPGGAYVEYLEPNGVFRYHEILKHLDYAGKNGVG
jgi:hypothetical protein